ncbi:peroxidase 28 [Cajanus cajan]|uniref:Peroxidase n=1 Tax=Cajanus cajan TaxID=3821 RepID=A0A151TGL0_CAJCA|nr:peroxidase 28 [Cajanus cajan]KYP66126.1 Peroxidase 28 [Cajanus cajan]
MKMSRIFLATLSLLLLFLVASSKEEGPPKLPFHFHSLFPFLGHSDDLPQINPQDVPPVDQKIPVVSNSLKIDFYKFSCPNAEKIIADTVAEMEKSNSDTIANFIRLQFHDCFVNGCDASILLDYSPTGDKVEKSSMFNGLLLKGADLIDEIKTRLEKQCPGVVSCADILSFATNEAMTLGGLPPRKPLGGRRDAIISLATVAEANNLPLPDWTMDQMIELFERKGFSVEEMVILLGAHSVGIAHCDAFMERAYNFRATGKPDPTLTLEVVEEIKKACPGAGTPQYRNPPVNFDPTPTVLDNLFFREMVDRRKTLLITDSHLLEDPRTFPIVQKLATDPDMFPKRFPEVMTKLSSLNVLMGKEGEIRKICRSTNV